MTPSIQASSAAHMARWYSSSISTTRGRKAESARPASIVGKLAAQRRGTLR